MPLTKLEDSDFNNVCELLETMPLNTVAEKYDVVPQSISRFLCARGSSLAKIKKQYRLRVITEASESDEDAVVTANRLKITTAHYYLIRQQIKPKEKFNYWNNCGIAHNAR